ncbi:hypothetical protein ADK55_12180 [Streptomyces sp. WM4235]|uniref:hypothetical protein n=1 Tax=Streptomyces sp. WM4235 TaxID=1415551 RepID=UPI0006AE796B|nr:hypothetical protein [Streptomyces sp. WM4235]KOU58181.1 hypothetical protein ADK55_12180 [Streptomyces sp. WM4235]
MAGHAQSLSGTTVGLAVDAICANPLPGHEIVELAPTETPNLTRKTLACPAGKTVLSGGVAAYNTALITGGFPEFIDAAKGFHWAAAVREISRPSSVSGLTAVCANIA